MSDARTTATMNGLLGAVVLLALAVFFIGLPFGCWHRERPKPIPIPSTQDVGQWFGKRAVQFGSGFIKGVWETKKP